jgi:hypothetical protein
MNTIVRELDGKEIRYHSETVFYVQVGRGPKGSYKPRYSCVGNLGQMVFWYNCINIGRGYKKRLLMGDKVLARQFSSRY